MKSVSQLSCRTGNCHYHHLMSCMNWDTDYVSGRDENSIQLPVPQISKTWQVPRPFNLMNKAY